MGSALLNSTTEQEFAVDAGIGVPTLRRVAKDGAPELGGDAAAARQTAGATHSAPADALRMQVAERLAAHRRRRGGLEASAAATRLTEPARSGNARSARIAAAVAERYAHTPSYRAFLAAEAERAIEQARAAAEVAATNARAIADAHRKMLDAFDEAASEQAAAQQQTFEAKVQRAGLDEFHAAHDVVQDEFNELKDEVVQAATLPQARSAERNLWPDVAYDETPKARVDSTRRNATPGSCGTDAAEEVAKVEAASAVRAAGLTVRLYEDGVAAAHEYREVPQRIASPAHANRREDSNDAEAMALDEEIAFRLAPVFEEPAGPPMPLPANLIEFPRQLVASRKARPRRAEGPLREEAEAAPGDGQLRIFEVDVAQISTQPGEVVFDTPQWISIWLDTPVEPAELEENANAASDSDTEQWHDQTGEAIGRPVEHSIPGVQAASISRRVTAAGVDLGIAAVGALAFAATSAAVFSRMEATPMAWYAGGSLLQNLRLLAASVDARTGLQPSQFAIIAGVAGLSMILLYHALFFWFADATPGMRCARIALCTFDDDNPTRRSVRRRLGAMLLSVCALGFGFVWALLDEDRLTWHDRITRMYLRSY